MNATTLAGVASVVALVALAGCTGGFSVKQTEPFRVQLEGAPQTVVVHEGEAPDAHKATVDTKDVDAIEVQVQVKRVTASAATVRILIQDPKTGETIGEKIITCPAEGDDGSSTSVSGNATGNETGNDTGSASTTATGASGGSGQIVVQNIFVNVKGKDNVVVLTQAQQGTAEVNLAAVHASGNSDVTIGSTGSTSVTETSTVTMTNSTTATSTSPY